MMTCDPAQALYARTDGGTGCELHTLVHVDNDWQVVGLLAVVIALVALGALVIAQLRG